MNFFQAFLSVVFVVRNQGAQLESIIKNTSEMLASLVTDYELIIIDNASNDKDESVRILRKLTADYPNLQVYILTKEVDNDTALWAGVENALGDFVAVIDPLLDDIGFLPEMLDKAVTGFDIVFARNSYKPYQGFFYRLSYTIFSFVYKLFNGIDITRDTPSYRILSRKVVNFILQYSRPVLVYRYLINASGFKRISMDYHAPPLVKSPSKKFREGIDRGVRLLISTTRAPMRIVTSLSLFGATANIIYSLYVIAVGLLKADVAPGWVSVSLQQSGMFFLLSVVLLVLGEYILYVVSFSNDEPLYYIDQEFTSVRITSREKLNIEEVSSSEKSVAGN